MLSPCDINICKTLMLLCVFGLKRDEESFTVVGLGQTMNPQLKWQVKNMVKLMTSNIYRTQCKMPFLRYNIDILFIMYNSYLHEKKYN